MPESTLRTSGFSLRVVKLRICSSSVGRRIIDLDVEHESIELRFRQRIRAFLLDRILRSDHEKRLRQRMRGLADRNFALLHRLQQSRLSFRRRAVHFVGQQNIREDRAFDEPKISPAVFVFVQHVRAGNVAGHQVGRELNAFELHIENPRDRADHQRFRQARHAFQQAMAAGENGGEHLLDHIVLPDDDFLQFLLHHAAVIAELLQNIAQAPLFDWGDGSNCGIGRHQEIQGSGIRSQGSGVRI